MKIFSATMFKLRVYSTARTLMIAHEIEVSEEKQKNNFEIMKNSINTTSSANVHITVRVRVRVQYISTCSPMLPSILPLLEKNTVHLTQNFIYSIKVFRNT